MAVAAMPDAVWAQAQLLTTSSAAYYKRLITYITGDWGRYGGLFTLLQGQWFWKVFLGIITVVPTVFLIHYLVIGAKHFDHDGEQVFFFTLYNRIVHFVAALSFSLLVITGLMIIFGNFLGGGTPIRLARYIHLTSATVFVVPGILMFLMWFVKMLPQLHDIHWLFILGGYLSKEKKPVPADKFNAGQKMYFWFATVGGMVMAYSGYVIWGFNGDLDTVRIYTMIHNVLGMAIVAFYLTHCYMSVFAIAGSLESMKTGYKPKDEVDILHSRYQY
ncbi:MAG: formate dehydrogenase subunit gamma [Proteobacteria bacterium]|nr:MAG: formate dehydrogenase subunit gamma [Pseudomonadota bacterium]PIE65206.1 MAG: formate dehydrogenase subunit gamma [Desulfobacterales bacterium]